MDRRGARKLEALGLLTELLPILDPSGSAEHGRQFVCYVS